LLFAYRLATELGKTVEEVFQMSSVEVRGWVEYFDFVNTEQKKARNKTRRR